MPIVYLGLGTNLGDREANLRRALDSIREFARLDALSSVYLSEPVGYTDQPDFWNMVVRIETDLDPDALLGALEEIEREVGREPSFRNAPRLLDIDILLYGGEVIDRPGLRVPHPRLLERAFVLLPLVELDEDLTLPGRGIVLSEHLSRATGLERAEAIISGYDLLGD